MYLLAYTAKVCFRISYIKYYFKFLSYTAIKRLYSTFHSGYDAQTDAIKRNRFVILLVVSPNKIKYIQNLRLKIITFSFDVALLIRLITRVFILYCH